ncbi:hypothetical protein, partial [Accumulibacter sp.]|uniref:hypothetical protein n=1 Tax=Accumulibacter sp. TaxID=2053492 RepID=UPI00262F554C
HRSAPLPRRGSAKPRSVTTDIAQIADSCASPGSVSVSEKGSDFVSAEASRNKLCSVRWKFDHERTPLGCKLLTVVKSYGLNL